MNLITLSIASAYGAFVVVIVVINRHEIATVLREIRDEHHARKLAEWSYRHPVGRIWDDVREAANNA